MRRSALLALCLSVAALSPAAAAPQPDPVIGDGGVSAFYTWPDAVSERGRLLREERLPPAQALPEAGTSLRILYSATDGLDGTSPVVVSGAVYLPKGEPPPGGWPLLAWAHGTVGVADVCAPSWAGRGPRDGAYLGHWLKEGYAIVASDYQGLGTAGLHPYLFARPAAFSMLDGIRAVQAARSDLSKRVAIVGQSQGAGAAFATAAFAPTYAPELDLRGVVATGIPYLTARSGSSVAQPDLTRVDPTIAYLFYLGLAVQAEPDAPAPERLFSEAAIPLYEQARTTCVGPLFRAVVEAGLTRKTALKPDFVAQMTRFAPRLAFPTVKLGVPVFIGTGAADNDVRPENQLALVRDACAAGTTVEAHLYRGLDHGATVNASLKDSVPFLRRAMAGDSVAARCDPAEQ